MFFWKKKKKKKKKKLGPEFKEAKETDRKNRNINSDSTIEALLNATLRSKVRLRA